MEITVKDVPGTVFLASTHTTTIPEIAALTDKIMPQIFAAADQAGLSIAGPVQFIYHGIDGNPETKFNLVVALPIAAAPDMAPPPFSILKTDPFHCATLDYVGPMPEITRGYNALMQGMGAQGLKPSRECREVYKHWIGFDSAENVTELQYGIA